MNTTTHWILPAYLADNDRKTEPIRIDVTSHIKLFLANKVWERAIDYGFNAGLKMISGDTILKAIVIIYPRFHSGPVDKKRIVEAIHEECGTIPSHVKLNSYKDWSHMHGVVIITVEYNTPADTIPTKNDLRGVMPRFDEDFITNYHQKLSVVKEIAAFVLAGLHLSFPTKSYMLHTDAPVYDGMFLIASGANLYGERVASNAFMHEILIEKDKLKNVEGNLDVLATVWHYNLWPLKRYLTAVKSDQVTMDNLLDLLYALEGMFETNASSDFIKTSCMVMLCQSRKSALELRALLDVAYRIRNEIAHGSASFDPFQKVKLAGKEVLAQEIYWRMKGIVAVMIIKAIVKLKQNEEMRTLRFKQDDLINTIFPA